MWQRLPLTTVTLHAQGMPNVAAVHVSRLIATIQAALKRVMNKRVFEKAGLQETSKHFEYILSTGLVLSPDTPVLSLCGCTVSANLRQAELTRYAYNFCPVKEDFRPLAARVIRTTFPVDIILSEVAWFSSWSQAEWALAARHIWRSFSFSFWSPSCTRPA